MSCVLTDEELRYLEKLLGDLYKISHSEHIFMTMTEGHLSPEAAMDVVRRFQASIDRLLERLKRSECPTVAEKRHIRRAAWEWCEKENKELMKRIYSKLKMKWTAADEENACML